MQHLHTEREVREGERDREREREREREGGRVGVGMREKVSPPKSPTYIMKLGRT